VKEALERAHELIVEWDEELRRELPADVELFDAHTHLGHDIDGMRGDLEEYLGIMGRYGIARSFVFCLDEPDRHPAFRAANDRTLAAAERAGGRLIPFVRLDLSETPVEEAERCLDRGAKGIKLHPRAQSFLLNDERLGPVFRVAEERRVPILIHGGRGLPPIADDLRRLVDTCPQVTLIIAHAGIADMAGLAAGFAGHAGVYYDTSVGNPIDLLDFFRQVSPEQVLYAADYPYGAQPGSLLLTLRSARAAGLSEEHVRGILGGYATAIADGAPTPAPGPPLGSTTVSRPVVLARISNYLGMARTLLRLGQPDTFGALGLAIGACDERAGDSQWELARIRDLLHCVRDLWRELPELADQTDRRQTLRLANRLVSLADIVAMTPTPARAAAPV
jgi:predicted TIM-barrel fold metal-dependent hydrolase